MSGFINSSPSFPFSDQSIEDQPEDESSRITRRKLADGFRNFKRKTAIKYMIFSIANKLQLNTRCAYRKLANFETDCIIKQRNQMVLRRVMGHWSGARSIKLKKEGWLKLLSHMKNQRIRQLKIHHLFCQRLSSAFSQSARNIIHRWRQNCCFYTSDKQRAIMIQKRRYATKLLIKSLASILSGCFDRMKQYQGGLKNGRQKDKGSIVYLVKSIKSILKKQLRYSFSNLCEIRRGESQDEDDPQIMVEILRHGCFLSRVQNQKIRAAKEQKLKFQRSKKLRHLVVRRIRQQNEQLRECLTNWNKLILCDRMQMMGRVKQLQELKDRFIESNM